MVTLGIDAHKRTHTVVAVDDAGRQLGEKTTTATTSDDHVEMLCRAERFGDERTWAVEDCRHLSRRLEADLLAAGERIVRVPPKLMAHARDAARTYGKSDPIDALAVARAALRHPDLPAAQLDGPARELRLLVDHREDLVAERTRGINRLRWLLHELDPAWDPPARSLTTIKNLDAIVARLTALDGPVARIAGEIVTHVRDLTVRERGLEREITVLVSDLAPTLLTLVGVGALTAAKIVAETADVRRFRSKDAYARHRGTAPLPVWSGNRERHRLSRTGNRQINAAIHRIAITQMRCHDNARAYLERRTANRNTRTRARRALKRHLSDVVYRSLLADAQPTNATSPTNLLAAAA
ncbi:IS110 family transposase [Rhabdothermincola sp.]|uniref:IS110 family transposase n=1 Tax=Rhabdothermincola sp. TaxID=2820405 RepID=UPI003FA7C50B